MSDLEMAVAAGAKYEDARAHALRARYHAAFGGSAEPVPVPVESIAEDLLGLRIEERWDLGETSGLLIPWICHAHERPEAEAVYCRKADLAEDADRALEREANVFAAELLMPESAVRAAWAEERDPDRCAVRLDVSPTAMRWRLYSFGLVEATPE
jgi:hypothetical protein